MISIIELQSWFGLQKSDNVNLLIAKKIIIMNQEFVQVPKVESFDVEYTFKCSTIEKAKRVMSFVDSLWGIEVTGGIDQFEPLTIVAVKKTGLARRAGIRVGDVITMINDTPADNLTMLQAQREIHESGRFVKIFVKG